MQGRLEPFEALELVERWLLDCLSLLEGGARLPSFALPAFTLSGNGWLSRHRRADTIFDEMSTLEVASAFAPSRRSLLSSLLGQGFPVDGVLDPCPLILLFLPLIINALLELSLEEAGPGRPMHIARLSIERGADDAARLGQPLG